MEITVSQLKASYGVAKLVFEGGLKAGHGAQSLHSEYGVNVASARDLIHNFSLMMDGRVFTRSMSAPAAEIYFEGIESDYGVDALARAISSMRQHIEYYEGIRKITLRKLRVVVSTFSARLDRPADFDRQEANFLIAVNRSLQDSSEERRIRLKSAPRKPTKIAATTYFFLRNQDVVAEVLSRAAGVCEGCGSSAPFIRRSDGSPYLEVHHRTPLANGGDDTVDNAFALCPNCHRRAHFGPTA
jgi:5-methylcytosine-specific restriction protein A